MKTTVESPNPRLGSKLILVAPPPKEPTDLLNAREVAQMLGVEASWVKDHSTRRMPFIPSVKWGDGPKSPRRYRREDILRFIEEHVQTRPKKRN